jgi:predicted membrane-bound mannosyltransferase
MIVHRPAGRVGPAVEAAQRFLPVAGWGAFVFVVLFWRLGEPSFWDPDEAHYAETTRELLASGDWLAPFYNEAPFFDKPILFHALQATAMAVFGATEFAARFVPALAALALHVGNLRSCALAPENPAHAVCRRHHRA